MTTTVSLKTPCSRCTRIDEQEIGIQEAVRLAESGLSKPASLRIIIGGSETIEFEHLCGPCVETVDRYVGQIGKVLTQKSSVRDHKDGNGKATGEAYIPI